MLRGAFLVLRFDLVLPFPVPHCRGQGAQARTRRRAAGAVPVRADLPHDRVPRHGRCAVPDPAHLQTGLGTRQDAVRPGRPSAQCGRRKPGALGHVRGRQLQRPHEHGTGRHHRAVRGARQAPRFRRRPKPLPATVREISLRMVRPQSAVGESAESKAIDKTQLDTQLASFARRSGSARKPSAGSSPPGGLERKRTGARRNTTSRMMWARRR